VSIIDRMAAIGGALWRGGVRLRCPHCGNGPMFDGLVTLRPVCDACGVRFERLDGESIGGMAITLVAVPSLALVGFFLTEFTTEVGFVVNSAIWMVFLLAGCAFGYRHARAAWIAISYLTGGVYADAPVPDTTPERQQMIDAFRATRSTSADDDPA
jgi:uncharacterized protein (DUF983 family)